MHDLVRQAPLAPSSHNTQCWRFRIAEKSIAIAPDLSRRCPAVDPDDHHVFVSLGCATESRVRALFWVVTCRWLQCVTSDATVRCRDMPQPMRFRENSRSAMGSGDTGVTASPMPRWLRDTLLPRVGGSKTFGSSRCTSGAAVPLRRLTAAVPSTRRWALPRSSNDAGHIVRGSLHVGARAG